MCVAGGGGSLRLLRVLGRPPHSTSGNTTHVGCQVWPAPPRECTRGAAFQDLYLDCHLYIARSLICQQQGPVMPLALLCLTWVCFSFLWQGDLGPFNPGLPVEVPLWLAINLKQRQKCRLLPPEWMDVGKNVGGVPGASMMHGSAEIKGSRFPSSQRTTITGVNLGRVFPF